MEDDLVMAKEREICRALVPRMLSDMGIDCSPDGMGELVDIVMSLGFPREDAVQTLSSLMHEAVDISAGAIEEVLEEEARVAEEFAMEMPDRNTCK